MQTNNAMLCKLNNLDFPVVFLISEQESLIHSIKF